MTAIDRPAEQLVEAPENQTPGIDVREYLRVLFRHKWGILTIVLAAALVSALYALSLDRIYRGTATLLIEREPTRFVAIQDVYAGASNSFEYYQTQFEIIRSRPIAEKVVEKLDLAQSWPQISAGRPFWQRYLPDDWFPPPPALSGQARVDSIVDSVQGSMQVVPIRNSQLVRIAFQTTDPELSARLANATADAYIEATLDGRLEMTRRATQWIAERMRGLREQVDKAESELQDYIETNEIISVEGATSLVGQEVSNLTARLAEARAERSDAERRVSQVKQLQQNPSGQLDLVTDLVGYALLTELRSKILASETAFAELVSRYGERHPTRTQAAQELESLRASFNAELGRAITALERQLSLSKAREAQLQSELDTATGRAQNRSRQQFELARLERAVESNRQILNLFENRFKETTAASDGGQNANARVIESARPSSTPVAPNRRSIVTIATFFALLFAIGLAFLLEHLDATLKGAEDVERRLALPVLGLLPRLKVTGRRDASPMRHFSSNAKTAFSEAIRTVRTGTLLSGIDRPLKVILVTSSVPGEGKSTLSLNLAYALGQLKKVLLVDCDMRRPSIAKVLDLSADKPGLSQLMTGDARIADCVTTLDGANLQVMTAGVIPPNPLEILSSKRFADTLDSLGKVFDHIVLDCPPALAVSDALVLSRLSNAVIYVVKADSTPTQVAQHGLKRLRRINAPLIGVVVNRVSPRSSAGYGRYSYYGDNYYQGYGYGYYTRD